MSNKNGRVAENQPEIVSLVKVNAIRRHEDRKNFIRKLQSEAFELRAQEDMIHEQRTNIEQQIRQEIVALSAESDMLTAFGETC